MLTGAIAVPLVGGAALAALAVLTAIVGMLVGYGLYFAWRSTLGWVLHRIADVIDVGLPGIVGGGHPLRGAANAIRKASDRTADAFLAIARGGEAAGAAVFSWASFLIEWAARETADLGAAMAGALAHVLHVELPLAKGEATTAATTAARAKAAPIDRAQSQAIARQSAHVGALERSWAGQLDFLARGIDRIESRELPAIRRRAVALGSRVGQLGSRIGSQAKRLGKVEGLLTGAAAAALVGTALGRLGLRWLRCGNVKRVGRRLCGMDAGLLEDLLLATVALSISFNLREFAEDVQSVTDETAGIIRRIVT